MTQANTAAPVKSKPQFIVAFDSQWLNEALKVHQGINKISSDILSKYGMGAMIIAEREVMERVDTFRQLLPYITFTKTDDAGVTRFFAYRRTDKVGEEKLAGNVSIGIGGHVDLVDVMHNDSVPNLLETVSANVRRELKEELRLEGLPADSELGMYEVGLLIDNTNEVGLKHLGLVLSAQVPESAVLTCVEEELETMSFMTAEELLDSGLPLENWTRIVLEHFIIAKRQAEEAAQLAAEQAEQEEA